VRPPQIRSTGCTPSSRVSPPTARSIEEITREEIVGLITGAVDGDPPE
jgi:hypothetical protein